MALREPAPASTCLCYRCYQIIMASTDTEAIDALKKGRIIDYDKAMDLVTK